MPKKPNPQQDRRREINKKKYAKGWETRRARQAERERMDFATAAAEERVAAAAKRVAAAAWENAWEPVEKPRSMDEAIDQKVQQRLEREARVSPIRPSESDGLLEMANIVRDDMLCSFVANMAYGRRVVDVPRYVPVMLTRMHAEAIEEFLREHGYSEFGKAGISSTKD